MHPPTATLDPRHRIPHHAEVTAFAVAALLVLVGTSAAPWVLVVRGADLLRGGEPLGAAAARQGPALVVSLPATAVAVGVLVFAVGVGGRLLRSRRRSAGPA